ncbi:MAG: DUF6502 family protein [Rhodoferax sp.]|nr:DUF6502 family protein [Rhodoferax sp.]
MRTPPDNHASPAASAGQSGAGLPEPALAAQAVAAVLMPLARLMIDHSLQLTDVVELLKQALVIEAADSFGLTDKGSSDTRIALLTGVHRKDVRRLRDAQTAPSLASPMVSVAASVVARWISEPRFLNADQTARALARTPLRSAPGEPDFTTLVAEVSRDVGARAVLDELARLGVVRLDDEGYVQLVSNAFVPREGLQASFQFLAANVSSHLAAATHNLAPDRTGAPKLEQSAFSQDLSPEQAEQLQQLARKLWSNALQQFLQVATVAEQRSVAHEGPKYKVRFGVYFHDEMQPAPTPVDAPAKTRKKTRMVKP